MFLGINYNNTKTMHRPFIIPFVFGITVTVLELLMVLTFPERPFEMRSTIWPIFIWILSGLLVSFVKKPLNRLYVYIALALYFVGNTNTVASYFFYGLHYYTDLNQANIIYSSLVFLFIFGLIIGERIIFNGRSTPNTIRPEANDSVFMIGSVIFPFVWILDQYHALGYIPIFSGSSIIEDMYSVSYGKLYGYGVLLGVPALLIWSKLTTKPAFFLKILLVSILLFILFVMLFDGRRIFLLVFIGGLLAFEMARDAGSFNWKKLIIISFIVLFMYVLILFVRQGGELIDEFTAHDIFSKVGVEYRDFSYVVTHVEPAALSGYDWLLSGVGGFFNQFLLAIVGIDKNALIFSGSAYQLALSVFNSSFGIRIGLLPELWLDYGLYSYLVVVLIGVFFVFITSLVLKSRNEVSLIIASMIYGVTILSFVGQTSAITGYYSLLLYLWFLWLFLDKFRYKI
ncbi:MAG: hypothetical protein U9N57_10345 [Pseudomonadota bacterium]|nr:hypothetical protein [Pseudomonadota bacterium]